MFHVNQFAALVSRESESAGCWTRGVVRLACRAIDFSEYEPATVLYSIHAIQFDCFDQMDEFGYWSAGAQSARPGCGETPSRMEVEHEIGGE